MLGTIPRIRQNPAQAALLDSLSPFVLIAGGWGSGKSQALLWKLLQLNRDNWPMPGLMIAQTFGALQTNLVEPFLATLERMLPQELCPQMIGRGGSKPAIRFADGTLVHLRSAEHPGGYDGMSAAFLLGDEIRYWSKMAYDVAISRVRLKGAKRPQRCFASTPQVGWMADEYSTGRPNRQLIKAPTSENARNLVDGYIDNIRGSYSPRLQRAMIDGEFVTLEGAVYDAFDPRPGSPWVLDWEPSRDDLFGNKVILGVDPGFRKSSILFFIEKDPLDWVCFDQIQLDEASDTMQVDAVNRKKIAVDAIWVDPAGDATQSATALDTFSALRMVTRKNTNAQVLRAIVPPFTDVAWGTDKLRVLLGGYAGIRPMLRFTLRLLREEQGRPRGIVRSLQSCTYAEKQGRPIDDRPLKEGVFEHAVDSARYFATGMWLTNPELRRRDLFIARQNSIGYRTA